MSLTVLWNRFRATGWEGWAVVLTVALGAFLRFHALGSESLWNDEISTLLHTREGIRHAISVSVASGTPPVYYMIQVLLRSIVPANEFGFRLLSAIADTCSIPLIYLLGRRWIGGPTAILGAAFYAVSIRAIWFAQEARAYSLSILVILVVALSLMRLIERPTWGRALVHTIAVIVLLYTHVYAIFPLVALEVTVLISPRLARRAGRKWLLSLGVAASVYLPWAFTLFRQAADRTETVARGGWSISPPEGFLTPIIASITEFAPGPMKLIPYFGTVLWPQWVFAGLVIFGVLGIAAFRRSRLPVESASDTWPPDGLEIPVTEFYTPLERRLLLGSWLTSIFIGGNLVSTYILPIFTFRMATQAMPALYLAVANGIRQLWKPAAIALLIVLALISYRGLVPYYVDAGGEQTAEKEQWREALLYVNEHGDEFDDVLVTPDWHVGQMEAYAELLGTQSPDMVGVRRSLAGEALTEALPELIGNDDHVLIVSSHVTRDSEGFSPLERALVDDPEWEIESHTGLKGIHLRAFVRRPEALTN